MTDVIQEAEGGILRLLADLAALGDRGGSLRLELRVYDRHTGADVDDGPKGIFIIDQIASEAEMARLHNDANVVTLAGRRLDPAIAERIVETFIATDFEGGRHARRVEEIAEIERE